MRAGRFAAEALGRATNARIVSRLSNAVLVMLDEGPLIALLPRGTPLHPWAVALAIPELPQEGVGIDTDYLVVNAVVDLSFARICAAELEIADLALRVRPETVVGAPVGWVMECVLDSPRDRDSGERWEERLDAILRKVSEGFGAANCSESLVSLIGLGRGLTPAGDDVLVGVLAGLDFVSRANPSAFDCRTRLMAALPEPLESRTTKISAQILRAATEGEYPEPLVFLASALADAPGDRARIECATRSLLAIGHDSGNSILRGFLVGLAGCCQSPEVGHFPFAS